MSRTLKEPAEDDARLAAMRALTRRAHDGQTRGGGVPYWVHTDGVAQLIEAAIDRAGEIPRARAVDIMLAAYGHDLYEDTDVTAEEIRVQFGDVVAQWISGMTNEQGDHDREQYQRKIKQSGEEVRLIKCADLSDNMLSVAYGLHDLGLTWTRNFFLPIAAETVSTLNSTAFERFPATGKILMDLVNVGWFRLIGAVDTAAGQPWADHAT